MATACFCSRTFVSARFALVSPFMFVIAALDTVATDTRSCRCTDLSNGVLVQRCRIFLDHSWHLTFISDLFRALSLLLHSDRTFLQSNWLQLLHPDRSSEISTICSWPTSPLCSSHLPRRYILLLLFRRNSSSPPRPRTTSRLHPSPPRLRSRESSSSSTSSLERKYTQPSRLCRLRGILIAAVVCTAWPRRTLPTQQQQRRPSSSSSSPTRRPRTAAAAPSKPPPS